MALGQNLMWPTVEGVTVLTAASFLIPETNSTK